jgi:hypothetical protein
VSETNPLVGAWRVTVMIPEAGVELVNLAAISTDGGILVVLPSPNPAAPGADHRLEYWTPAIGSWAPAGPAGATMSFVTLGTDETGASLGSHVVSATVEVDANGTSWHGPFVIDVIGTDGNHQGSISGSVVAIRIPVTPSSAPPKTGTS